MSSVTLIPTSIATDRPSAARSSGPFSADAVSGGIRPARAGRVDADASEETEASDTESGDGPVPVDVRLLARCDTIRLRGRHRRH